MWPAVADWADRPIARVGAAVWWVRRLLPLLPLLPLALGWLPASVAAQEAEYGCSQPLSTADASLLSARLQLVQAYVDGDLLTVARQEAQGLSLQFAHCAVVWQWHGLLAGLQGDAHSGVASLQRASQHNPLDPTVWHNLGHMQCLVGQSALAHQAFARAAELWSGVDSPQAQPTRGDCLAPAQVTSTAAPLQPPTVSHTLIPGATQ